MIRGSSKFESNRSFAAKIVPAATLSFLIDRLPADRALAERY